MRFMVKLAVIGDSESIKGFACLGLDIFVCENDADADDVFKEVLGRGYGVIFITEHLAEVTYKQIQKTDTMHSVSVVPIPAVNYNNGIGISRLSAAVEKAVGSDIIFNKERVK